MNTTYFLNQVMGNVFGSKKTPALPTQYWLGLSSTEPLINGTNAKEPSITGTGYSRILWNATDMSAPTDGVITNTKELAFPKSLVDWGTMTHYVVYDAQTGGNLLIFGELEKARIVQDNTINAVLPGDLTLSLLNPGDCTCEDCGA